MYTLRFDGIFWGVPNHPDPGNSAGFLGYGWLIFKEENLAAKGHGVFARGKDANSSIAEYLALIEGLEALLDMRASSQAVEVFGDAKGIIDQMVGHSAVHSPCIKPLYRRAIKLAGNFLDLHWKWTPRKHNREADRLTRRAMRQVACNPKNYLAAIETIQSNLEDHHRQYKLFPLLDLRVYQPGF